ncbi:hypothetical protein [Lacipirellula sp.]|uniref:hypothetical protein n=1 Tax=Lacipirellula sp. TaxID=2691419 RepID=UPI003D0EF1F1
MSRILVAVVSLFAATLPVLQCWAAPGEAYDLSTGVKAGDVIHVDAKMEVGGDLFAKDAEGNEAKLATSVVADMSYDERLINWSSYAEKPARSLRNYFTAKATLKTDELGADRQLAKDDRVIVVDVAADGSSALNGLEQTLTRHEFDLVNVIGNSLLIERLLPGRALKESEGWDHDAQTIGGLVGMDNVAVCEVRSVVTGMENRQVQIRLAGVIHGTVDGAASEMDLRGAYLFHLDERRITKFNMAIKEVRKAGEVSPGLDVVAKLSLVMTPLSKTNQADAFDTAQIDAAKAKAPADLRRLRLESADRGYRFMHDKAWFLTAEQREALSLRLMVAGELLGHCNITTLPVRPADKPMTLQHFEENVVKSLGDKLGEVKAATEWANASGHQCLGIVAVGTVDEVPMQWRYYFIADAGKRPTTVAVTVEQSAEERFADADRAIIDTLVLLDASTSTAAKPGAEKK